MMFNENIIEINEHEVMIRERLEQYKPRYNPNEKYEINIEVNVKSESSDSDDSFYTTLSENDDISTDTASEFGGYVDISSSESTWSIICSSNDSTLTASEGLSNHGNTISLNEVEGQEYVSTDKEMPSVTPIDHNYTEVLVLKEQNTKGKKFQKSYLCEECQTGFTTKKNLIKHKFKACKNSTFLHFLKSVEIKLPFLCKECNKTFVNEIDFNNHNQLTKCNETNLIKRILNITRRKLVQQEVRPFCKENCANDQEFCLSFPDDSDSNSVRSCALTPPPTVTQQNVAPKSRLADPTKLLCAPSPQNFDPKNYLKTIICNKCNQKFPNDETFEDHFYEKDNLTCKFCGDSNFTEESLVLHLKLKHSSEEKHDLTCKLCEMKNLTQESYDLHIKKFHSSKKNKNLKINKTFKKKKGEKMNSTVLLKEFFCYFCYTDYLTKELLDLHRAEYHNWDSIRHKENERSYKTRHKLDISEKINVKVSNREK